MNTSYIFIPICYEGEHDFHAFTNIIGDTGIWELGKDEITYMFRYITDKINGKNENERRCIHFQLKQDAREQVGLKAVGDWYYTKEYLYKDELIRFGFQIQNVHFYCFTTNVCILTYQIQLEKSDPMWVAAAEYYLKKVSREIISESGETMMDITKNIVEYGIKKSHFDYFFYANEGNERANILTYLEVPEAENYKKELYYLRYCYKQGFTYVENPEIDKKETYIHSQDIIWGISPEATVCLACPNKGRADFITTKFRNNFQNQYFFLYLFLLHQKYGLYMFLTKLNMDENQNLKMLESYKKKLYEFEADFVYTCVTEVPQHQKLYDKLKEAFLLKEMFIDVKDPLVSLNDMRRLSVEDQQKKRDENVNGALLKISVLAIFSALADGIGFIDLFFSDLLQSKWIDRIQYGMVAVIVYVAILIIRDLIKSRKK